MNSLYIGTRLIKYGWLAGWLAGWLLGCLADWLPGCLAGCLAAWLQLVLHTHALHRIRIDPEGARQLRRIGPVDRFELLGCRKTASTGGLRSVRFFRPGALRRHGCPGDGGVASLRVWAKGVFPLLVSDRLLADAADHLDLNVSWGQVAMRRRT